MELKVKILKWSSGIPVAMLNEATANILSVKTKGRIFIRPLSKNSEKVSTIVDIAKTLVKKNEVGVSTELRDRLNLTNGQKVDIDLSHPPESLLLIKKKMNGDILSEKEIGQIITDVVNNSLSEPEIALFVSAMYENGMNMKETISLIKAILGSGKHLTLKIKNKIVADKHSIGGIPGNRTTPIVVAICAAAGLVMPKSSSRAITTPAGTADVIESVADVDFTMPELKKIVQKVGACLIWGGSLELVPADEKIITIEKSLNIDPESQLLASIMSKKLALGAKYILIDIPYGKNAKVDKESALRLKKKFEFIGRYFKKKLKVVLTKGDEPIGHGIGPALEMMDIVKILKRAEDRPLDLEKKSVFLAGVIFEMTKKAQKGKGIKLAQQMIDSGKAFKKLDEIIKAQNGDLRRAKFAKFKKDIIATKSCEITSVDNKVITRLARIAGCPLDKSAGLYLYNHVGTKIKKGDKILTIFAESKSRLTESVKFYNCQKPIKF